MRYRLLLPLLILPVLLFTACGGGGTALKVGDVEITQDQFNHWMETNAQAQYGFKVKSNAVPDAPEYKNCIANQKSLITSKVKPSDSALKELCKAIDNSLRQQTMQLLAAQAWVLAQANKENIKASDKQVDAQYKTLKEQFKQTDGGVDEDDLRQQAKATVLSQLIRQKAYDTKIVKPSQAQLRSYYDSHQQQFAQQATRNSSILVAANRKDAQAAVNELRSGKKWDEVFKKYNDKNSWGAASAQFPGAVKASFQPDMSKAVWSAPIGKVAGPIKMNQPKGWLVVQVASSRPAVAAKPFDQIKQQVLQAYNSTLQVKAADRTWAKLQKEWQQQTTCAKEYQDLSACAKPTNKPAAKSSK